MEKWMCTVCGYIHTALCPPTFSAPSAISQPANSQSFRTRPKNLVTWAQKQSKNLLHAFAGESQVRNKYTFFAQQARAEGFEQIAALFQDIP